MSLTIDKVDHLAKNVEIGKMMKMYGEAMERPHENLAVAVAEPKTQYGADAFDTFARWKATKGEPVQNKADEPKKKKVNR